MKKLALGLVLGALAVASCICSRPVSASSVPGVGNNSTTDPTLTAGVTASVGSTVFAGDVVFCEAGVACDSSTPTSEWSDVLVFFDTGKGPFVADDTDDATVVELFSDDGGSLASFISGSGGILSGNAVFFNEVSGTNSYAGTYFFNSFEGTSATPEPSSIFLLGTGLLGIPLLRRFAHA